MKRKAAVLGLLEQGPATTGDIRRKCSCRNAAQAHGTLKFLAGCGVISGRRVARDNPRGGPRATTLWALTDTLPADFPAPIGEES